MSSDPIRLKLRDGSGVDLNSLEEAAAQVCAAAHEVRLMTQRAKSAHEAREEAYRESQHACAALVAAQRNLEIAQGNMRHVEAGNVLKPPSTATRVDPTTADAPSA